MYSLLAGHSTNRARDRDRERTRERGGERGGGSEKRERRGCNYSGRLMRLVDLIGGVGWEFRGLGGCAEVNHMSGQGCRVAA